MKYRALRDGYIGGHYVFAGETFTHNGKKPSWARLCREAAPGQAVEKGDSSDSSDESDTSDETNPASPEGYAGTREQQ